MKVMQTTSVNDFNDTFKNLEQQLILNKRLAHTLSNPIFKRSQLLITSPCNSFTLDNSTASAELIWVLAKNTYNDLQVAGTWQTAVCPPIKKVNFANTGTPSADTTVVCWNCGKQQCRVDTCDLPIDQVRVGKNRAEFLRNKRKKRADKRGSTDTSKEKSKAVTPHAWRAPEPDEHGKRVIYGNPHTWNPLLVMAGTKRMPLMMVSRRLIRILLQVHTQRKRRLLVLPMTTVPSAVAPFLERSFTKFNLT